MHGLVKQVRKSLLSLLAAGDFQLSLLVMVEALSTSLHYSSCCTLCCLSCLPVALLVATTESSHRRARRGFST